jgi:hypothetical protein
MLVEVVTAQQFPFSPPDRLSSAELRGFLSAMEQGLDAGTTRTKVQFSQPFVWLRIIVGGRSLDGFLQLLFGRYTV